MISTIEKLRVARRSGNRINGSTRQQPTGKTRQSQRRIMGHVGKELAVMKPYIASFQRNGCRSGTYADQMDKLGATRCRSNMETLLRWMRTAADGTGVVFIEIDSMVALLMAITRAEMKCR